MYYVVRDVSGFLHLVVVVRFERRLCMTVRGVVSSELEFLSCMDNVWVRVLVVLLCIYVFIQAAFLKEWRYLQSTLAPTLAKISETRKYCLMHQYYFPSQVYTLSVDEAQKGK